MLRDKQQMCGRSTTEGKTYPLDLDDIAVGVELVLGNAMLVRLFRARLSALVLPPLARIFPAHTPRASRPHPQLLSGLAPALPIGLDRPFLEIATKLVLRFLLERRSRFGRQRRRDRAVVRGVRERISPRRFARVVVRLSAQPLADDVTLDFAYKSTTWRGESAAACNPARDRNDERNAPLEAHMSSVTCPEPLDGGATMRDQASSAIGST